MARKFINRLLQVREGDRAESLHDLFDAAGHIAEKNEWVRIGVIELIPDELLGMAANEIRH